MNIPNLLNAKMTLSSRSQCLVTQIFCDPNNHHRILIDIDNIFVQRTWNNIPAGIGYITAVVTATTHGNPFDFNRVRRNKLCP